MITTFIDTSYLIAFLLTDDEYYERAKGWQSRFVGQLLTTEYVLVEFVDAFAAPHLRQLALDTLAVLRGSPGARIVPASTALMNEGELFFKKHADKEWSLTDCISFVVMRREGLHEALSSDHDFEQAGFRALLRSNPPRR